MVNRKIDVWADPSWPTWWRVVRYFNDGPGAMLVFAILIYFQQHAMRPVTADAIILAFFALCFGVHLGRSVERSDSVRR